MPDLEFAETFRPADPAALARLVGDARIVAIGENNHHVEEFGLVREQLLRLLVTELGFDLLGFEGGFAEGRAVDRWIAGGPGDVETVGRDGFTFSLGESPEMHDMLTWLRAHNAAGGDVRFAGLDVPASAGSPLPALIAVREYLAAADPAAVSRVDAAIAATEPYHGPSSAVSPGRYAAMDDGARHTATGALAGLLAYLDSVAPVHAERTGTAAQAIARQHALGALRLDAYLAELAELGSGGAGPVVGASRDAYMADTVRLLRRLHPDRRIVLMVHNGHLQRVALPMIPGVRAPTMGMHLAREFGDDYFALALTAVGGSTPVLTPDNGARLGFELSEQELEPPTEGSVEHALTGRPGTLLDLRRSRGRSGPGSIRHAHMWSEVDITHAWDALICLPEMRASGFIRRNPG